MIRRIRQTGGRGINYNRRRLVASRTGIPGRAATSMGIVGFYEKGKISKTICETFNYILEELSSRPDSPREDGREKKNYLQLVHIKLQF